MFRSSLVLLILGVGCVPDDEVVIPEAYSDCRADEGDPWTFDPLDEEEPLFIVGSNLHVEVGYSGGCAPHDFQICWDGLFAESEPVQVHLDLWHYANEDACEAYLYEELVFDLTPLKEAYLDAYSVDGGTITLSLGGHAVDYTFGP